MKKLFGVLLCLLVLLCLIIFLLPAAGPVSRSVSVPNHFNSVNRVLQHDVYWQRWWPEKRRDGFVFGKAVYAPQAGLYNAREIIIRRDNQNLRSRISVLPQGDGACFLRWELQLPASNGFLGKIKDRLRHRSVGADLESLLEQLKSFASADKNIYGLTVRHERVKDTVLIAKRFYTTQYPGTEVIYTHIQALEQYIKKQDGIATNHPMLHVNGNDKAGYDGMVAIPTNRMLPGNDTILQKRMVPGNILIADVQGGQAKVEQALLQLDQYANDHALRAPAIPFALLVTHRQKITDTTRWKTHVCYPVY